jgi:ferredoxin
MKATVDESTCTGCGLCADLCPEVFELGDDNLAKVKVNPVPANLEASCKEAAESCPVTCIQLS